MFLLSPIRGVYYRNEENWSPDTEGRKPEHFKERGRDFSPTLLPQ